MEKINKIWTPQEIDILKDISLTHNQVVEITNRTYSAVKSKRKHLKISPITKDINYWTPGEEDIIKNNPQLTNPEIAKILNRTIQAVTLKRNRIGLFSPPDEWNEDEIKFLSQNYHKLQKKEIAEEIGRSVSAVISKAYEIGITSKKEYWTKKEITILIENPHLNNESLSKIINKTENQIAYKKAYINSRNKKVVDKSLYKELDSDIPIAYNSKSDRYADLFDLMEIGQSFEYPAAEAQHIQTAKNHFPDKIFKIKSQDEKTNRIWRIM